MNIDDIAYTIYQDHICMCTVDGVYQENNDIYFSLYDHYHCKQIPHLVHEHYVYEDLESMTKIQIEEHRRGL